MPVSGRGSVAVAGGLSHARNVKHLPPFSAVDLEKSDHFASIPLPVFSLRLSFWFEGVWIM